MPGRLTERVQAVILGAVAALPRESRYRAAARLDAKALERLTTAMTAWARGAGTNMASFADRFFGRSADDPIVGKLWAATTMADRARSHADLRVAATDLADAQQLVGLDRWPRFIADAELRLSDTRAYAGNNTTNQGDLKEGGASGSSASGDPTGVLVSGVHLVAGQSGMPVDLQEEEAHGGHAISEHVGKSASYLLNRVRAETYDLGKVTVYMFRSGSFPSVGAAEKLVNSTLSSNAAEVNRVATGQLSAAFVQAEFGAATGIEAFRTSPRQSPYIRDTFSVGASIIHDPTSPKGYSVRTAYPLNR